MRLLRSFKQERWQWRHLIIAVLSVAIAFLMKLLLNTVIEHESPFLVFFAAVLASARYGGLEAGLIATALSTLVSDYFFLYPAYSLINHDLGQNLRLVLFAAEGIAICEVVASLKAAKQRAEQSKQDLLQHQETLRQSEESFRLLVEGVKDYAIFMLDLNGNIISWNKGAERILGYRDTEIIGQHGSCIFTPEDIQCGAPEQELKTALTKGQAEDERWHVRKNGTRFWASGMMTAIRDETGSLQGFSKIMRDMTRQKQAEQTLRQSEERMRLALEVANMSSWEWNILTNQVTWSHNYELLFGMTSGTFGGTYEALLEHVHPEDRQLVAEALTCCLQQKVCYDHEFRAILPDGNIRWLAGKGQVFYDENSQALRMIGITRDVTARKRTEEQIKASLQEKEVLLKEIHHRVKNNLQIISSLLSLQSGYVEDEKTLELLKAGENRVASMGLIHEQLYQSKDLARIDFAKYLENLAANLFGSYNICSEQIDLKINVDHINLGIDAAIPCGLIVNELISNSLKYAFPKNRNGEVWIRFYQNKNHGYILSVSDNGIGFPEDTDFLNTESLGLQIVTALTGQLGGMIELNREFGTEFKISF